MKKLDIFNRIRSLFKMLGGFVCLTSGLISIVVIQLILTISLSCKLKIHEEYYNAAEMWINSLETGEKNNSVYTYYLDTKEKL